MNGQESTINVEKSLLNDWVDVETRHIDVVASWESLCAAYDTLRFTDPLSDDERLGEFKWITHQMNGFLSKMRTKLLSCKDREAMIEVLQSSFSPTGKMELDQRRALAYQKLKQQWVKSALMQLDMMSEELNETEGV